MARPVQGRRRPQNRPLLNFSVFTRADTAPDVVELAGVVVATLGMVCWDVQGRQVPKLVGCISYFFTVSCSKSFPCWRVCVHDAHI